MSKELETVYLSATQIENFVRCPRLWGWQKIAGLERERSKSLELGTRVHEILETYYLGEGAPQLDEVWRFTDGGKIFYPGRIASQMISGAIPADAVTRVKPELAFENKTIGKSYGVVFVGKIDIHWLSEIEHGQILHIVDHKTSADPEKWGKKEKDLPDDIQQLLYSRVGIEMYPKVKRVQFALNYGSTALQKRKNYWCYYNQGAIIVQRDFLEKIEPVAKLMAHLKRNVTDVLTLEPNASVCQMFGGCSFIERCQLTQKQKIGAFIMAGMSLKEKLAARLAAGGGAAVVEPEMRTDPINPPEQNDPEPEDVPHTSPVKEVRTRKGTPKAKEEKLTTAIKEATVVNNAHCSKAADGEAARLIRNLNRLIERLLGE